MPRPCPSCALLVDTPAFGRFLPQVGKLGKTSPGRLSLRLANPDRRSSGGGRSGAWKLTTDGELRASFATAVKTTSMRPPQTVHEVNNSGQRCCGPFCGLLTLCRLAALGTRVRLRMAAVLLDFGRLATFGRPELCRLFSWLCFAFSFRALSASTRIFRVDVRYQIHSARQLHAEAGHRARPSKRARCQQNDSSGA